MNHTAKKVVPWIIVIAVFIFGFYLSTQRPHSVEKVKPSTVNQISNDQLEEQEFALKQRLVDDFEAAFLKQYTPLLGCEEIHNENQSTKCNQHLEQAKNDFKDEFIKNRGLPKNTFETLNLSQVD